PHEENSVRQLLVERMAVRSPSMLPEFLAVIRDHYDERVIQHTDLLQLVDELLQAPVVMQHFAVVAVNGPVDKTVRVDSAFGAERATDYRAAAILRLVPELHVIAVEFGRLRGIGKLVFEP